MYQESKYNKFYYENNAIFLFNSFTRACIKVDQKEAEIIKKLFDDYTNYNNHYKEYYETLIKNGFIIPDHLNELDRLEYLYYTNYFRTDYMNVVLVPTLKCNFKCPYCFEEGHKNNYNENEDYFIILKKFADKNFINKKRIHITLFGGEPLLKEKELFSYLNYLLLQSKTNHYELNTNIVTNGYLLNEDILEKLVQYNCISIQVTLDGSKKSHDKLRILHNNEKTFDTIINNFKKVINYAISKNIKMHFILRINLFNQDIENIKGIFNYFTKNEKERIDLIFRPIYSTNSFYQNNFNTIFKLKKFYDEAAENGFGIIKSTYYLQHCESDCGISFFHITPDLKIRKCLNDLSCHSTEIGMINQNGVMILHSDHIVNWFSQSNPFNRQECRECYYLPVCYGGCVLYKIKKGKHQCTTKDMSVIPYLY